MSIVTGTAIASRAAALFPRRRASTCMKPWRVPLPPQTPAKLAYDGKDLEIMVKGPVHNDFASLFDRFIRLVARHFRSHATVWVRQPGSGRHSLGALRPTRVTCSTRVKLDLVKSLLARRVNDVAEYPNPDLAVEVDISSPVVDRESVYAALRVPEIWVFDGEVLTIKQLDESRRQIRRSATGLVAAGPARRGGSLGRGGRLLGFKPLGASRQRVGARRACRPRWTADQRDRRFSSWTGVSLI